MLMKDGVQHQKVQYYKQNGKVTTSDRESCEIVTQLECLLITVTAGAREETPGNYELYG